MTYTSKVRAYILTPTPGFGERANAARMHVQESGHLDARDPKETQLERMIKNEVTGKNIMIKIGEKIYVVYTIVCSTWHVLLHTTLARRREHERVVGSEPDILFCKRSLL